MDKTSTVGLWILSLVFLLPISFITGQYNPDSWTEDKIKLSVYEEKLGEDVGKKSFACDKLKGALMRVDGQLVCAVPSSKLK